MRSAAGSASRRRRRARRWPPLAWAASAGGGAGGRAAGGGEGGEGFKWRLGGRSSDAVARRVRGGNGGRVAVEACAVGRRRAARRSAACKMRRRPPTARRRALGGKITPQTERGAGGGDPLSRASSGTPRPSATVRAISSAFQAAPRSRRRGDDSAPRRRTMLRGGRHAQAYCAPLAEQLSSLWHRRRTRHLDERQTMSGATEPAIDCQTSAASERRRPRSASMTGSWARRTLFLYPHSTGVVAFTVGRVLLRKLAGGSATRRTSSEGAE